MKCRAFAEILVSADRFTELFNEYCQINGINDIFLESGSGNEGYGGGNQPQAPRMIFRFGTRDGVRMSVISASKLIGLGGVHVLLQGEGDFYPISKLHNDISAMEYEFDGSDPNLPATEFDRADRFSKDFRDFALKKIFSLP